MSFEIDTIPLHAVRIHADTQSRVSMNEVTIAEYAEAIRAGSNFPPVVTYFDGTVFWLADGFHRYFAHKAAGAMEIASELREGSQRDAILFSVGANAAHGLRRTNEDKRRAVQTLLDDAEWSAWSDREIARQCHVSNMLVGELRKPPVKELSDTPAPATRTIERNGKTYEQDTTNIGKANRAEPSLKSVALISGEDDTAPELPVIAKESTPAPVVSLDEMHALQERFDEIADSLKSTLADNEMMGRVFDADDRVKASMVEANRQKAIAESAERTLASKSGEFVARAAQVTHWMNRAQKAEKALAKLGAAK